MAKHTFIISDENVNSYGFRILTDGIDTAQYEKNPVVLFMHDRAFNPQNVIGKGSNLRKEGTKLLMDVEFDSEDEYAKTIEGKVKRGFIKMASLSGNVVEDSMDVNLALPGQKGPTVTKLKLREVSIVDIGSNDEALRLYDSEGAEVKLADFANKDNQKQNLEDKMNKELELFVGKIALQLGCDATEVAVENAAKTLKANEVKLAADLKTINDAKAAELSAEAISLTDKMVEVGALPAHLKEVQLAAFEKDFAGQKSIVVAAIAKVENPEGGEGKDSNKTVELSADAKNFLDGVKGAKSGEGKTVTLADLSPKEIEEMKINNPKKFEQLVEAYEGTKF